MIKFQSISLFTRLYLTIAVAMIVSGTISFIIIEKVHVQGAIDEYVLFTDNIYADLLKDEKIKPTSNLDDLNDDVNKVEGYLISWKILLKDGPPCEVCEWVADSGEVEVYRNDENQWFAVYKLPDIDARLTIFENNIFHFDEEDENTNFFTSLEFHDIEELTQLSIVFITIAVAIYWPVSVLKRQIENLIKVQRQFGAGDLSVRANDQFSKPIDELATSFNEMANSITDTVKENQVFAQAVPHEARTPLSRIQLAVGLLSQNNDNQQQVALLDNIDTYIGDINMLINQVVAFSKLNSVKNEGDNSLHRKINLKTFIEERIIATESDRRLKVISQLDDSLRISANPAYLRLTLDNLLKNAVIHGKSQIVITLHSLNGQIHLSIMDDGDGIPIEHLTTVFIPFSRLDESRSRNTGGLGLGLAIAKAACKRMNSKISVENGPTGGAKFTCLFHPCVS